MLGSVVGERREAGDVPDVEVDCALGIDRCFEKKGRDVLEQDRKVGLADMHRSAYGAQNRRCFLLLGFVHERHDGVEVRLPVHERLRVDAQYWYVYPMCGVVFWRFYRRTPDVVNDTGVYVSKAIGVPKHFDDCGCAKRVACHGDFIHVEAVFPSGPVDAFEAPRTRPYVSLLS